MRDKGKRWSTALGDEIDSPPRVEEFLDAYEALCLKFDLSLGHEDRQGGFEIDRFARHNIKWVRAASFVADAIRCNYCGLTYQIGAAHNCEKDEDKNDV